jgi:Transcriptional regulator containing an amidase domain and an AraC-type DNA-binding HTH domain
MQLIEKSANVSTHKTSVAVLLFDGAEVIDYSGPWEAFGEAGFKIFTVADKTRVVNATFGQKITADYTFANSPRPDILLVPGGGIHAALDNPDLIKWVRNTADAAQHVMSVCNGAFILARAGLLDGLSATTVNHEIEHLAQVAPKTKVVHDKRYVDNGKVITSAGLSSGIDGAFHLISKIKGKGVAQATALGMEYRWDPNSDFARAALADRYLPEINDVDGELVSTEGDLNHWEIQALVSKPNSIPQIIDLISKRIVSKTPHVRGPISLLPVPATGAGDKSEINWKFTDEDGRDWKGSALVKPAPDQAGKFSITLKLVREPNEQA